MNTQQLQPMQLLAQSAVELGLLLDAPQLEQFEIYYRELADWNTRMNLTSVIDYPEVQVKHFLDSLTLLPALGGRLPENARVVDVGAGAGFPGLPLKLVQPDLSLTLVESTGKKAGFLRHMAETLGLESVEVYTGRAETLAHQPELRETHDVALARGLARLPTLLEITLPFVRQGGVVAAWKHGGEGLREELASARNALQTLGGHVRSIYPVKATGLEDNRVVAVIEKVRETPDDYPRRNGVPRKQPL
ncbi:MAG: 16S rRNA (guanine(527)-N(7))-methyltransferase RsmG [Chloroflexi bacterium]|nr:16S rRNA (guanine(527)-N(7))-methyltransferase RsmG [Chloroflexota bacterium]